ncbi:MAG: hypothetical protein AB7T48_00930 [Solirubrobacterales bacterium]
MSASNEEIVDLDDESSWPEAVRTFVADQAERLAGSTELTTDLLGKLTERDEEFHSLFPGRRLLAFHATSLFEYEIADIRRDGLRLLSSGLVAQKIDEAHARGEISTLERDQCLARNVYAIDNEAGRGGRICLVVGRSIFDRDGGGLTPFLGGWGGESMNGGPGPHEDPVLQTLGRPSIVAATVDLGAPGSRPYAAPSLPKVFVASASASRMPSENFM